MLTRFLSAIALIFFPCLLPALYNGNPDFPLMPEEGFFIPKECWLGVKGGYEWDDLFNHYLEVKKEWDGVSQPIQKFGMMGNFGVLTLGLRDRVEAYGAFGMAEFTVHQKTLTRELLTYKTDSEFAWSVGGRFLLAYFGNIRFSLDAKYFESHPEVSSCQLGSVFLPTSKMSLLYEEWQVGGSVTYCWKWFAPYVGIKHSNVSATIDGIHVAPEILPAGAIVMKQRYDVGVFCGLGWIAHQGFNANMEWRFVDEFGVTLSADIRF